MQLSWRIVFVHSSVLSARTSTTSYSKSPEKWTPTSTHFLIVLTASGRPTANPHLRVKRKWH